MKSTLLFVIFSLTAYCIQAQQLSAGKANPSITGVITSSTGVLPAGTIRLLRAEDSVMVHTTLSDSAGQFQFDHVQPGNYLLAVEALGYQKYCSPFSLTTANPQKHFSTISLSAVASQLDQVVVTHHPPAIEQRLDKTVIHIDASPTNTGLNTLEILEKSPGITVDQDGNVTLNGKTNPLVMIDGKPTYLTAAALATLLQSMPGTQLDQIEIMTNPPAKYDAAGNAGIINIKTKKGIGRGFNGSATAGGGFGTHGRSADNFTFNYNAGKVNFFANYSYSYIDRKADFHLLRNIRDQQTQDILQTFDQRAIFHTISQSHVFKTGVDFDINKKTTIGVAFSGMFSPQHSHNTDSTFILNPHQQLDSLTFADTRTQGHLNNRGANLNFRHAFHQSGQELTADADYLHYDNGSNQLIDNFFFDRHLQTNEPEFDLFAFLPSTTNIYSAKADYTQPLTAHWRLDAGTKVSLVKADNNAGYFDGVNTKAPVDSSLTNHFLYKENIQAGYFNLNGQFRERWTVQAGLRVEHTRAEGNQLTTGQNFVRDYTQFFPTAYLSYMLNTNNTLSIDYGRRIQRPEYSSLNPFLFFVDKYSFESGNPNLQPQLSNTIEVKYGYKELLTASLSYSNTSNLISEIVSQNDSSKIIFESPFNFASSVNYAANITFNKALTKWWTVNVFAEENYQRLRGVINKGSVELSKYVFQTTATNTFNPGKGWNFELSGSYNTGFLDGTARFSSYGFLNFGASRQVLAKKGTIRLTIRDIANTLKYPNITRYQNTDTHADYKPDSRIVSLSFTYRFSKGKVSKRREHGGASEEEQSRVKQN